MPGAGRSRWWRTPAAPPTDAPPGPPGGTLGRWLTRSQRTALLAAACAMVAVAGATVLARRAGDGRTAARTALHAVAPPSVSTAGSAAVASATATAQLPSVSPTPPAVAATAAPSSASAGRRSSSAAPAASRTAGAAPAARGGAAARSSTAGSTARTAPAPSASSAAASASTAGVPAGPATPAGSATTAGGSPAASTVPVAPAGSGGAAGPLGPPPALSAPVAGPVLTGFGWAFSPVFSDWQEHTGVDIGSSVGRTVVAPGPGVVTAVRSDSLWGVVVSIALGDGYSTNVSPLQGPAVRAGQTVAAGTALGAVAPSPPAEVDLPPHVFWQLFSGSRAIDPQQA